ncbi:MAG: ATP synthase F1 subunit epsilon [Ruminococcaceae bacterium]|nr:ATP synthase F1 subunit epsilon [Oscillospiraceae bacterium]
MTPFQLKIVTPDGLAFDGQAEELIVRTTSGDLGILAGHMDCVAPLGMGRATIVIAGKKRYAACIGGMLSVIGGHVNLVPTTFEWAEDIDVKRAEASYDRAKQTLENKQSTDTEIRLAEARLKRALVRKSIGVMK